MASQAFLQVPHDKKTSTYISDDLQGVYHHTASSKQALSPNSGQSASFYYDDSAWWAKGGNITTSGGFRFNGENGKEHWLTTDFGVTAGIYPNTQVSGCRFTISNDSTAGHALWVRKWGVVCTHPTEGDVFHGADGLSEPTGDSYGDHHHNRDTEFTKNIGNWDQSLMDHLSVGWVISKVRFEITTEGGKGTRETNVVIKNFRWVYRTVSGKTLILPAVRTFADRFDIRRIGNKP